MHARSMTRQNAPESSVMAAERLLPHLNDLQRRVLHAIRARCREAGRGITDRELEALEEFSGDHFAYSTIRKRRTELFQKGFIRRTGHKRDGFTVWEPVPAAELLEHKQREAAQAAGQLF